MKGIFLTLGVLAILVTGGAYLYRSNLRDFAYEMSQPKLPQETRYTDQNQPTPQTASTPTQTSSTPVDTAPELKPAPKSELNLPVAFTSQAPHTNWDFPYQESCEEASLIMAWAYFNNKQLTPDTVDTEILKVVEWQNSVLGTYLDTTAEVTKRIAQEYFELANTKTRAITSKEDFLNTIKSELSQNHLIVIPAAGRLLRNPNFTSPGPLYHMLVIKGYTKNNTIITNDPGTRRGHNYTYSLDTLYNALHDFKKEDIENGAKVVLIIGTN